MSATRIMHANHNAEISLVTWIASEREFVNIPEEYFYHADTKAAYREICDQYRRSGTIEATALSPASFDLTVQGNELGYPSRAEPMVETLSECWKIRTMARIVEAARKHLEDGDGIDDIIAKVSDHVSKIAIRSNATGYDHERSVYEYLQYIEKARQDGHGLKGISSNLEHLDAILSGWQKGKTYIVGGMEKLGKSRFCCELSNCWLQKGIGGIWFSQEMRADDIHECHLSNRCIINGQKYGTADINADEIARTCRVATDYMQEPLYIDTTSSVTPAHVRSVVQNQKVRMQARGYSVVWVIVDYIQRMVDGKDKAGQLEDTAKALADIARDENIVMIVISQLSQEAERSAGIMSPHQFIKGSKGIREAADSIIVLHRDTKEEWDQKADSQNLQAYVVQRRGISNVNVPIIAQLQYSRFRD